MIGRNSRATHSWSPLVTALLLLLLAIAAAVQAQSQWTTVPVANSVSPPALWGAAAVWDPVGQCMWMFGGRNAQIQTTSDTWSLCGVDGSAGTTAAWTKIVYTSPSAPPDRYAHSATYDGTSGMFIIGGLQGAQSGSSNEDPIQGYGGTPLNDVWYLNFTTLYWSQVQAGPRASPQNNYAYGHVTTLRVLGANTDPPAAPGVVGLMLVGGWGTSTDGTGSIASNARAALLAVTTTSTPWTYQWTPNTGADHGPGALLYATGVYLPSYLSYTSAPYNMETVLLYGGIECPETSPTTQYSMTPGNNVYPLNVLYCGYFMGTGPDAGDQSGAVATSGTYPNNANTMNYGVLGATATLSNETALPGRPPRMFVFGGSQYNIGSGSPLLPPMLPTGAASWFYVLDLNTLIWTPLDPVATNAPANRWGHVAVATGADEILLWGGITALANQLADVTVHRYFMGYPLNTSLSYVTCDTPSGQQPGHWEVNTVSTCRVQARDSHNLITGSTLDAAKFSVNALFTPAPTPNNPNPTPYQLQLVSPVVWDPATHSFPFSFQTVTVMGSAVITVTYNGNLLNRASDPQAVVIDAGAMNVATSSFVCDPDGPNARVMLADTIWCGIQARDRYGNALSASPALAAQFNTSVLNGCQTFSAPLLTAVPDDPQVPASTYYLGINAFQTGALFLFVSYQGTELPAPNPRTFIVRQSCGAFEIPISHGNNNDTWVCECQPGYYQFKAPANGSDEVCVPCAFGQQKPAPGPQHCKCQEQWYNVSAVSVWEPVQCLDTTQTSFAAGPDPRQYQDCARCMPQCMNCTQDVVLSNSIAPLAGYWQGSYNSPFLYACYAPDACIGGSVQACATGYTGPLCTLCEDGYSGLSGSCQPCGSRAISAAILFLSIVALVFVLVLLVKTSVESKSSWSIVVKILVNYAQALGLIGGFRTAWPNEMAQFLKGLGVATATDRSVFYYSCVTGNVDHLSFLLLVIVLILVCIFPYLAVRLYTQCRTWYLRSKGIRVDDDEDTAALKSGSGYKSLEDLAAADAGAASRQQPLLDPAAHNPAPAAGAVEGRADSPALPEARDPATGKPWEMGMRSGSSPVPGGKSLLLSSEGAVRPPAQSSRSRPSAAEQKAPPALAPQSPAQGAAGQQQQQVLVVRPDGAIAEGTVAAAEKHLSWRDWLWLYYQRTALIVLFTLWPLCSKQLFTTLQPCIGLAGHTYLAQDMSIDCDSKRLHDYRIASWLLVLIVTVGGIVALFVVLYRHHQRHEHRRALRDVVAKQGAFANDAVRAAEAVQAVVDDESDNSPLRFLYEGYTYEAWYWELVLTARKLVLVALAAFLQNYPLTQSLAGLGAMNGAIWAQTMRQPFALAMHNRLEFAGLGMTLFTLLCCSLYDERRDDRALTYTIIVANTCFIAYMLYMVAREGSPVVRSKIKGCTDRCCGKDVCDECDPVAYFCPQDGQSGIHGSKLAVAFRSAVGGTPGGSGSQSARKKADFAAFPDVSRS